VSYALRRTNTRSAGPTRHDAAKARPFPAAWYPVMPAWAMAGRACDHL